MDSGLHLFGFIGYSGYVITSDAPVLIKALALLGKIVYGNRIQICDGVNDYVEVQAVHDALGNGDSLKVVGNNLILGATGVTITHELFTFDLSGIISTYTGIGYAYTVEKAFTSNRPMLVRANFGVIVASGAAVTAANAAGLCLKGCLFSNIEFVDSLNFNAGAAMVFSTSIAAGEFVEMNYFGRVMSDNCKTGLMILGDSSTSYNDIKHFFYAMSNAAIANCVVVDIQNNTLPCTDLNIGKLSIYLATTLTVSGVKGINGTNFEIREIYCDTSGDNTKGGGFLLFNTTVLNHHVRRANFYTMNAAAKLWASGEQPYVDEFYIDGIAVRSKGALVAGLLLRDNFLPLTLSGGTTLDAGTGGHYPTMQGVFCFTGIVPSAAGAYENSLLLDFFGQCNWESYFELNFIVMRAHSDGLTITRIQLGNNTTLAALGGHGLGIRIDNLALKGISRGTGGAEATVDLGVAMISFQPYYISIRFFPGSRIEWWGGIPYADITLLGTQSGASIPSIPAPVNLVYGMITTSNPATQCFMVWGSPWIWLERVF